MFLIFINIPNHYFLYDDILFRREDKRYKDYDFECHNALSNYMRFAENNQG